MGKGVDRNSAAPLYSQPRMETRFRCVVCGKVTAGRIGQDGGFRGDGSHRYPRKHRVDGEVCPGVVQDAEWVDIPV